MPLRPELRNLRDANGDLVYRGPAWKAQRERLLERCGNKCERCRKSNHAHVWVWASWSCGQYLTERKTAPHLQRWHYCLFDGSIGNFVLYGSQWKRARRIRVVLTMAHLTHDPLRNSDEEKAMLCQWCHLHHDRLHHRDTRCERKERARPLLQSQVVQFGRQFEAAARRG